MRAIRLLLLCLLMGLSGLAQAECTLSRTNAVFGQVSSFAVNASAQNTSAGLQLDCDTVLNLLTSDFVRVTYAGASSSSGTRAVLRNTTSSDQSTIPVMLCAVAGCGSELNISGIYTWSGNTLLGLLTSKRYSLPLYLRTVPGQSVSAGTWQTTLSLNVNWSICSLGVAVCLAAQTGSSTVSITVTLVVTNDCSTLTTPVLDFGSAALVSGFSDVRQTISITCTKGSVYTVGINNGNYASGGARNLANGSSRLRYEIYKGTGNDRWGVSGNERWPSGASTSQSSDGLLRTYAYTARILSGQATPPPGNYSDTLVVDVAF